MKFGISYGLRNLAIDLLLWLLSHVEQCKSRCLAWRLHDIADRYDPRPTGKWSERKGNDA